MVQQKKTPLGEQIGQFFHRKNEQGVDLYFGGKPLGEWFHITAFYIVYYLFLAGFWAMCLVVMLDSLPAYQSGPRLSDILVSKGVKNTNLYMQPGRGNGLTRNLQCFADESSDDFKDQMMAIGTNPKGYFANTDLSNFKAEVDTMCNGGGSDGASYLATNGSKSCNPCFFLSLNRIRGFDRAPVTTIGGVDFQQLPIECHLLSEEDDEVRSTTFNVKSFFVDDEGETKEFAGFMYRPFPNSMEAKKYVDPAVVVRMSSDSYAQLVAASQGDDVLAKNIECGITQDHPGLKKVVSTRVIKRIFKVDA